MSSTILAQLTSSAKVVLLASTILLVLLTSSLPNVHSMMAFLPPLK